MRTRLVGLVVLLLVLGALGARQKAPAAQAYGTAAFENNGILAFDGPTTGGIGSAWFLDIEAPCGFYSTWIETWSQAGGYQWTPGIPSEGISIPCGAIDVPGYGVVYNYGQATVHYAGYTLYTNLGWQPSVILRLMWFNYTNSAATGGATYQWSQDYGGFGGQYNSTPQNHWCGYYWGTCDLSQPTYFYGSCGYYYGYCDYYGGYYFAWDYNNYCYCVFAGQASQYGQYQSDEPVDDAGLRYAANPDNRPPASFFTDDEPWFKPGFHSDLKRVKGHPDAPLFPDVTRKQFHARIDKLTKDSTDVVPIGVFPKPEHFDAPQPTTPKQH